MSPLEFVKKVSLLPHPGGDDDGNNDLENDEIYELLCEIRSDAIEIVESMGLGSRHAARRRGAAPGGANGLYLYRSLDVDEDGDPIDYGVVRAGSLEEAAGLTRLKLRSMGYDSDIEFKMMKLAEVEHSAVLETQKPTLHKL